MSYLSDSSSTSYVPMRSVLFRDITNKTIESYYGEALMVDFANKKIGGGVLKNGCVQEEILFAIFPEAIISKLICD
jgi:poly(ADP-ribose) glycohydrolase